MPHVHSTRRPGACKPAGFAAIGHHVVEDPRLKATDIRVLAAVLRHCRAEGRCWPSNRRLADIVHLSVRTVQYSLRRLEAAGYLRAEATAANRTGRLLHVALDPPRPVAPDPMQPAASPPMQPVAPGEAVASEENHPKEARADRPERHEPTAPPVAPPHREIRPRPSSAEPSSANPSAGPVPLSAPTTLTPAEASRLAAMPGAARERIEYQLLSGDRILVADARDKLRPPPTPAAIPATTAELLARLDEDASYRPLAARRLADDLEDPRSFAYFWQAVHKAPPGRLLDAYRQATRPGVRTPGAAFVAALKRPG